MVDLSGGTNASSDPVTYYRTLADVPGGANSDAYKTTNILMRLIPKGNFTQGSPAGELGRDAGETQHQVTLSSDFYIGVFEVTQQQWEYARRAGTSTALNSGYNLTSTGNDPRVAEVGRYWYNGGSGYTQNGDTSVATAKVGAYQPNQWGLYDMHGNVWEWSLDWYGTYPGAVTDPKGASSGSYRVLRGGSWNDIAPDCRSAFRNGTYPDYRSDRIGFRACCAAVTLP